MQIVNVPLLRNPLNWAIVWLMVFIAAIAGHFLLSGAGVSNPHDE